MTCLQYNKCSKQKAILDILDLIETLLGTARLEQIAAIFYCSLPAEKVVSAPGVAKVTMSQPLIPNQDVNELTLF